MNKITGAEYPIKKIYSENFDFVIPDYQRPYAWGKEQAGVLFDDFYEFMKTPENNEPYFLGSIVLIKKELLAKAEVIDGQQRLTTLTILLAVISHLLKNEEDAREFKTYINEPGKRAEGLEKKPRLALRDRDRDFFRKYIQEFQFDNLLALNPGDLSDSQKNIRENAKLFIDRMMDEFNDEQEIFDFGKFIINQCYLVAVSTSSQQSAYRVFSVLNNRGLDLLPTDLLKAEIIGKLKPEIRTKYAKQWDETEEELGRDDFNDLFTHIRMIYRKVKAQKTMLEEFNESVLKLFPDKVEFIDEVLLHYAKLYDIVKNANYRSTQDASKINTLIKWLLRIDNFDWIPPAMYFLSKHKNEPDLAERFFKSLECLAASMFMRRFTVNQRIERYAKLMTNIEGGIDFDDPYSSLFLSENEIKETIDAVSGDVYLMYKRPRTYLLLRLDSFMSDQSAIYDHNVLTVEHVLPQTVNENSYWSEAWPDEELRANWLHKLGNLVILSRRKNSQAQNYDFDKKKEKYFSNQAGISSISLTTDVLNKKDWTPEVVRERQDELINVLKKGWNWELN